jgi:transcriptional regulator with XRE-family HTH domain
MTPVERRAELFETFRDRVLVLRERTRLTEEQLASRLGVSTRTIQYWRTGSPIQPRPTSNARLAHACATEASLRARVLDDKTSCHVDEADSTLSSAKGGTFR